LAAARVVAGLEPDPLANLVRGRLPRPAEVAVELEPQLLIRHRAVSPHEAPAELRRPSLAGRLASRLVPAQVHDGRVLRDRQLQVHADVDDDSGGPERLRVQHAELVAGIIEVAEVVHEPLRVERPALAVPRAPTKQPLPAIEQVRPYRRLGDLQVVAGHAFVVDRRDLLPGGEGIDALGNRPPHAARAGEVLARPGVVDAPVRGRCDAALDPAYLLGNVEVAAVQI